MLKTLYHDLKIKMKIKHKPRLTASEIQNASDARDNIVTMVELYK